MPRFIMIRFLYGLSTILLGSGLLEDYESCPDRYFSCGDKSRCLSYNFVCDGENDCKDFSDEKACHMLTTIKPENCTGFQCLDGLCIPHSWACNGEYDCLDGSDEHLGCTTDNHCDGFHCNNGPCVPSEWKCDGKNDCQDGSDEINCPILEIGEECTLNNRKFLCKDGINCIPINSVCNRHADCPDGSDEGGQCFFANCTDQQNNRCQQDCMQLPTGHQCICYKGYKNINGNCTDINECELFGACDQKCENTIGSYNCSCIEGYDFEDNVCKAKGADVMLLFSTSSEVRIYFTKSRQYFTVVNNKNEHIVGVGYDGKHIYWTTIADGYESLMRADILATEIDKLFTSGLGGAEDIAVDHVTSNIYFTDSVFKHIAVCDQYGHMCVALYKKCDRPRAIVLHQSKGIMMWTDWGKSAAIMQSGMDGSDVKYLITKDIVWPNGLALDQITERLYWADANLQTIETVKLDGTDRRKIISSTIMPFGLDVFEDKIYWSDWLKKGIMACNKFTGKNCEQVIKSSSENILGIHVYHPNILNEIYNPCLISSCSHLCLLSPKLDGSGADYQCKCPESMELSSNKHSCIQQVKLNELFVGGERNILRIEPSTFGKIRVTNIEENLVGKLGDITYDHVSERIIFSDLERHTLMAFDVKRNKAEVILSNRIGRIIGLEFDGIANNLFWADEEMRTIEVMNLNNNIRLTLIRDFANDIPLDIALNTEDGIMYIAVHQNGKSCIDRVSIDGSLESRIHMLPGLVTGTRVSLIYQTNLHRLFFTDSSGKIASTDKDGHDYHILKELHKLAPINLAFVGPQVFWTVYGSSKIYFDNTDQELHYKFLDLNEYKLGGELKLAAHRTTMVNVSHECHWNNGNCSAICLPKGSSKKCICENNARIAEDGKTCQKIKQCEWNQYKCSNDECIPYSLRCDSKPNCPQGEDELDCDHVKHCPSGTYKCADKCIGINEKCESSECHGDAEHCQHNACTDSEFKCTSGQCIPKQLKCDSQFDCQDRSDEINCTRNYCNADREFKCKSGQCIPIDWECDSQIDCNDGSDEHSECEVILSCNDRQLSCNNGHCIDKSLACNGDDDCEDGSDELNCPTVGTNRAEDVTSTQYLTCDTTQFLCSSSALCLPIQIRCNGTSECPKGEDEVACEGICPIEQFKCPSNLCIPKQWVCDGLADCPDGYDELNCHPLNATETVVECKGYECKDGSSCVLWSKLCDGKDDCKDGSDEGGLCGRSCETAGCHDKCMETPLGHRCSCSQGFQLAGDGRTCLDINECLFHFSCSQYCHNSAGSYRCSCHPAYLLRSDRIRCKAKGPTMEYLYATKNEIRRKLQTLREVWTVHKIEDKLIDLGISGLDVDMVNRIVYWTREMPGTLMKVSIDESETQVINDLNIPTKLSYDWITDQIYLIQQYRIISVCSFKVKTCVTLYTAKPDVSIRSIAIDAKSRIMIWSETKSMMFRSSVTVLKAADMSGGMIKEIVKQDIADVSDLAVDSIHQAVYWSDREKRTIERCSYNGSLREEIYSIKHIPLDIALFEEYVYWINSVDGRGENAQRDYISRCALYGTQYKRCDNIRLLPSKSEYSLTRLRLLHPALQSTINTEHMNKCLNTECEHLCVLGSKGPLCICSDGQIQKSGEKCKIEKQELNIEDGSEERSDRSGTTIGWWFLCLIILVSALLGYIYFNTTFCQSANTIPPVHFQNSSDDGISGPEILASQTVIITDQIISPGMHEYENPLKDCN
ncbi:hypothetical protein O3M35_004534 [Rhynocoris fuscipes]|uniref:EGF-like domain-containing protein n=1 Tax=Rhynocoris fuscipes TaxID=488301 RepID=A0AAW1CES8_9HEMI